MTIQTIFIITVLLIVVIAGVVIWNHPFESDGEGDTWLNR